MIAARARAHSHWVRQPHTVDTVSAASMSLRMSHEVVARLRQLGVRRGIECSATTSGLSTAVPFQLVAAAAYGTRLVGVRGIVGRT